MKRLIIGLMLVICLLVPVSCTPVDATYEELKTAQQEAGQLLSFCYANKCLHISPYCITEVVVANRLHSGRRIPDF